MKIKNKIFTAFLAAWVIIWISFNAREIFVKGGLDDYRNLLSRTFEGKRSYVTGDRFYEFLVFCNERLPAGASYEMAGIEDQSHDRRRASYYLYPHMEKKGAEYLLVYGLPDAPKGGYGIFAGLDRDRYILKKN
jgi:hypothetical protein